MTNGALSFGRIPLSCSRHCEERQRRSNPASAQAALDCFADARNDDMENRSRDAIRARALLHHNASKNLRPPRGSGAPKGACQPLPPRRQACAFAPLVCVSGGSALLRGALAFRRSAAALARANASAVGSAPVPAFPETRSNGRYPLRPVTSLPSSSETGRHAGRAVAQSRPRADGKSARRHRPRSAFQACRPERRPQ